MTKIREIFCLILLLLSVEALATTPSDKQIDRIYNSTGGSLLSVPSTGSNVLSDTFSSSGQVTFKLTDGYGGFHVQSTTGSAESSFSIEPGPSYIGGAGQWIFYTNGSNLHNQNDFAFYDSELSTSVFIIQSSTGYLGVGTNNPGYQLDVNGTLHAASNVTLSGTGNSVGTITSGTWNGTAIATTYGGTGISSTATFPSSGTILTDSNTETLSNKTISGGSNTLSELPVATQTQQYTITPYPNGSATNFTLSPTPPASGVGVQIYLDGQLLRQGAGLDYTISGSTITLTTAPATGQVLYTVYSSY